MKKKAMNLMSKKNKKIFSHQMKKIQNANLLSLNRQRKLRNQSKIKSERLKKKLLNIVRLNTMVQENQESLAAP